MSKIKIEEEMGIHKEWYVKAKEQTLETLPGFMNHILNNYEHDYGTICHALAACGVAAVRAANASESGGITGFQAGAVMWEFIRNWMHYEKQPLRLVDFKDMLYPQYQSSFEKTISAGTWAWLQEEAKALLSKEENKDASERVKEHWENIVLGFVPFGYEVEKEEEYNGN